jgi:DNA-binding beta-propeller fold protein YncE
MNVFHDAEFRAAACVLRDDSILVSDARSNSVLRVDLEGNVMGGIECDFKQPEGIAVSRDGEVYVVDRYNGCVKVFAYGEDKTKLVHQRTFGEGILNQPVGIAIAYIPLPPENTKDNTRIYVADNENHRVMVYNKEGEFHWVIGEGYGQGVGQLFCPCGVAWYKGLLIVAEWGNGRVQVFNKHCKSILCIGGFPHAHDVGVDLEGNVYVALYSSKRIRKFKIDVHEDGTPTFTVGEEVTDLIVNPTSLLVGDKGVVVVVGRTKVVRVTL